MVWAATVFFISPVAFAVSADFAAVFTGTVCAMLPPVVFFAGLRAAAVVVVVTAVLLLPDSTEPPGELDLETVVAVVETLLAELELLVELWELSLVRPAVARAPFAPLLGSALDCLAVVV